MPTSLITCKLRVTMYVKQKAQHIAHTLQMLDTRTAADQKKPKRQKRSNSRGQNIRTKARRRDRRCGREKMDLILCELTVNSPWAGLLIHELRPNKQHMKTPKPNHRVE